MKFYEIETKNNLLESLKKNVENSRSLMEAIVTTALEHGKSTNEIIEQIQEEAPPGAKAERFIKKNKADFKKRYGDRWEEVLYATAWKQFGESEELSEATTKDELVGVLSKYPEEVVKHFEDSDTFTGYMEDNRKIGRLVNKLMDTTNLPAGPIMRVAEQIKEYNRVNLSNVNDPKKRAAARSDRMLRTRTSSGKATARKF